ncbi:MAG: polymerase subunit beta, partial [Actinomycetota bacterium]|nr:polymerase subunit beta [Actinomycetota bacterium]
MDVTAPAHRLSAAVSAASRLLPARTALRLRADAAGLTIAGSDPDLTVRFDCPATTHTDGEVAVPAAPLAETLKMLGAESVRVVVEGSRLALRLDQARFALPLLSPAAGSPPSEPPRVSEVDGPAFASALRIVAGTAAKDDPLPLFTGVRVQRDGGVDRARRDGRLRQEARVEDGGTDQAARPAQAEPARSGVEPDDAASLSRRLGQ